MRIEVDRVGYLMNSIAVFLLMGLILCDLWFIASIFPIQYISTQKPYIEILGLGVMYTITKRNKMELLSIITMVGMILASLNNLIIGILCRVFW